MRYLSAENVIQINFEVVEATGGSQGLRDTGLLESAVGRPQSTFSGKDLYTTIFRKAAALIHSLLLNYAFVDGNKRTATVVMIELLTFNGKEFEATNKEVVELAMWIEGKKPTIEQISKWIKNHSN